MNVLIAKNKGECARWKGTAVVVDVLCSASTVCALVGKNAARAVFVCAEEETAVSLTKQQPKWDVFSKLNLPFRAQADSPAVAQKFTGSTPALVVSGSLGGALQLLRSASLTLVGGFCNFTATMQAARQHGKDILLISASLLAGQEHDEDALCTQAFKEFFQLGTDPRVYVQEFARTLRYREFIAQHPQTGQVDVQWALLVDGVRGAVQVALAQEAPWAVCFPLGKQPQLSWAKLLDPTAGQVHVQEENAGADITLRPMLEKTLLADALQQEQPAQADASKLDVAILGGEKNQASQPDKPAAKSKSWKGFFSHIVQAVKEEKNEVEQAVQQSVQEEIAAVPQPAVAPAQSVTPEPPGKQVAPAQPDGVVSIDDSPDRTVFDLKNRAEETIQFNTITPPATLEQMAAEATTPHLQAYADAREIDLQTTTVQEQPLPPAAPDVPAQPAQPVAQDVAADAPVTPDAPAPLVQETPVQPQPAAAAPAPAKPTKKAVVLFSGGLDSTTCLYWAMAQGYECEALTVSYGQRHLREVVAAQAITRQLGVKHHLIELDLPWLAASSLVDTQQALPDVAVEQITHQGIPSTYVPGRNLMFLAIAGSLADTIGAAAIVAGPNAIDFSGYPDCTPAFHKAAAEALNRGTQQGLKNGLDILTPLMELTKAQIVQLAHQLQVPLELTWSCYAGGEKPCGTCDSCKLRAKGFAQAGLKDPTLDK